MEIDKKLRRYHRISTKEEIDRWDRYVVTTATTQRKSAYAD